MREKKKVYASEIVQVGAWKAFVGFAVDFFLSFALLMVGTFFISPFLQDALGANTSKQNMQTLLEDSRLFSVKSDSSSLTWGYYFYGSGYENQLDKNGKIEKAYGGVDEAYVGHYPYELYTDIIFSYYYSFSFNEGNLFVGLDRNINSDIASFSVEDRGKYIGENIFGIKNDKESYFAFDVDENNNPKYTAKPVLNMQNETVLTLFNEQTASVASAKLTSFFVHGGPLYDGVYELTCSNLQTYQPRFKDLKAEANNIIFVSNIPIRLIPPMIFFLLIPLILRDGKTLGRLLANTAVIDVNGYSAKKDRILLHQLILYLPWLLSLLPYDVLAIITVVVVYFTMFLVINLTSSKRGIHELIAGTMTVNDLESSYFSSKEEYEEYVKTNPNSLEEPIKEYEEVEPEVEDASSINKEEEAEIVENSAETSLNVKNNELSEEEEDDFVDKK